MSLKDLKVGDEVAIMRHREAPRIVKIDRVTATQIITGSSRWNRKTGDEIPRGDWFYRQTIEPATDAHRHADERRRLLGAIDEVFTHRRDRVTQLKTETLRTIAKALREDEGAE